MRRRPPRSTQSRSSAASDVYKRQNFLPADRRLKIADVVACFDFLYFLAYELEVVFVFFLFAGVFGRYIRLAQGHEIIDMLTCIVYQSPYGRIGDEFLR